MSKPLFTIEPESESDAAALAGMCAAAFGPGRFARTAYRVREGARPARGLSLVARREGMLAGSVRFTEILIGGTAGALLLGPLVIDPGHAGQGCGRLLLGEGLSLARGAGYRLVLLVGDLPYYEKSGFRAVAHGQIVFPGPVDPARILAAELEPGSLGDFSGQVATG